MLKVTIDCVQTEARPGETVLNVAQRLGVTIPTLCHHPDLSPVGSCRLCLVQVEGIDREVPACSQRVIEGMVIRTTTPEIIRHRKMVLELLLRRYVETGGAESVGQDTEFMRWVRHFDVQSPELPAKPRFVTDSDPNPFIQVDLNKCILCTRCIRACDEVQGRFVWHLAERGADSHIVAGEGTTMLAARCESCGACAAYCPTGALLDRTAIGTGPLDRAVTTTCGYCGVGCQFDLNVRDDRVVRVTSNPAAPVNGMSLCVKGRYGHTFLHHPDRLIKPRVRKYLLDGSQRPQDGRGEWVEVDWDTALAITAERLAMVKSGAGPDAIAVLSSAKCTNEENYLLQKLARQVLGTNHIDHCARLCHASTLAGLRMAFGTGAMTNSMDDVVNQSAAIFIIGSNTTEQHPVFGTMIRQAVLKRNVKLVVADPRRIDITEFAAVHLQHRPGTDTALVNGLVHIILKSGWHDQEFIAARCENFEEFPASVDKYTPEMTEAITGVPAVQLRQAAQILSQNRPMAVVWAMGITQHTTGVLNVLALANLQMLLGNLGIAGGGVSPLRGQNNVQGSCDMGALPDLLPGYQAISDPAALKKFTEAWRLSEASRRRRHWPAFGLPAQPGLTVTEIIHAAGSQQVKALYILGEDPAMTDPDLNQARACLAAAEFIVLQEIFPSETAVYADVLLPGAAFAEKDGTFTNTERRIQLVRKAIDPPGEARPDWLIVTQLAERLLKHGGMEPAGRHAGWAYQRPSEIMDEIAALTPSYAGVSQGRLDRGDRLQWPVNDADHAGTPILYVDSFVRGKGKFHAVEYLPPAELPDERFPLLLTTGRVLYHWHGGELTRRAANLLEVYPEPFIEINAADAARLAIKPRQFVRVVSRRGEVEARADVTDRVAAGVVFGNFHFPGPPNINNVTNAAVDPVAKIPEYKACAVRIEPAVLNA